MNKSLSLLIISALALGLNIQSFSQKNKGKKDNEAPSYTEDLTSTLPVYNAFVAPNLVIKPSVKVDSLKTVKTKKTDDSQSVDSVTEVLKKYYSNKTKAKGWRIQIWDGQTHTDMKSVITNYENAYSDLDLILHDEYDKTLFRVRIGDFTDRLEAFRYLQIIKKEFPNALLVPDQVELSKI